MSKKQTIVPPIGGWKPNTWYIVEVAFNANNPVFGAVFFSGFLNNGRPAGYNEIAGLEDKETISRVYYLRAIRELTNSKELQNVPQRSACGYEITLRTDSVDCTTKLTLNLP